MICLFPDNISAICDIWLIGDAFLRDIFPTLQAMNTQSVVAQKARPFMYEYYNVIPEYPVSSNYTKSTAVRIFNQLVSLMNEKERLPKYILLLPDKDILSYVNHKNFGIGQITLDLMNWLCKEIELALDLRREDIRYKRPGALWSSSEPRLVWVKMLTRPIISNDPKKDFIFAQRTKFNEILEEMVLKYKHSHIMPVKLADSPSVLFERNGSLSSNGKSAFWREVNKQMKLFDSSEIDLKPEIQKASKNQDHKSKGSKGSSKYWKPPSKGQSSYDRYHYYKK